MDAFGTEILLFPTNFAGRWDRLEDHLDLSQQFDFLIHNLKNEPIEHAFAKP